VLLQGGKDLVLHRHVQRHLGGVLDDPAFDHAQRRLRGQAPGINLHMAVQGVQFVLCAAGLQEVRCVVVVFVFGARQQRHGANAQFPQLPAGGQLAAHRLEIDVPAARQRFAPQQRTVQVDQCATAARPDGVDQIGGLGFAFGGPVRNAHGG
jgi:hypothetical protein